MSETSFLFEYIKMKTYLLGWLEKTDFTNLIPGYK